MAGASATIEWCTLGSRRDLRPINERRVAFPTPK
jgi:hypothetical protein